MNMFFKAKAISQMEKENFLLLQSLLTRRFSKSGRKRIGFMNIFL